MQNRCNSIALQMQWSYIFLAWSHWYTDKLWWMYTHVYNNNNHFMHQRISGAIVPKYSGISRHLQGQHYGWKCGKIELIFHENSWQIINDRLCRSPYSCNVRDGFGVSVAIWTISVLVEVLEWAFTTIIERNPSTLFGCHGDILLIHACSCWCCAKINVKSCFCVWGTSLHWVASLHHGGSPTFEL